MGGSVIAPPASPERIRLADRLRDVRLRAGLTGRQLSARWGWQPSKVSRLETGAQLPTEFDVLRWSELCGDDPTARDDLLALRTAATGAHRAWQHRARHGLPHVQADYDGLVDRSGVVRHFETAVVPGLLQTPHYARAVIDGLAAPAGVHLTASELDEAVALRMQRQRHLYDPGKAFEFLVAEPVLRWRCCPPEVLLAQLDRLRGVVGLPRVRFGVLPLDVPMNIPPLGAFQLYDGVAVVETFVGETIHVPDESATYARFLDRLWAHAATGDDALALVGAAADRLRTSLAGVDPESGVHDR
jgi:transcriptional regulator with XRE-family HTH domain